MAIPFLISIAALAGLKAASVSGSPDAGVDITDLSGSDQDRPFTISRVFAQGEFPKATYPQAVTAGIGLLTQVDVKNRWDDGSIRHALVSFRTGIAPRGSIHVGFIRQPVLPGSNAGYLDKAGMLSYADGSWGARIKVSNGSTLTADARSMLSAWNGDAGPGEQGVRYWLKGPVVTQVIVEDRSPNPAFDLGWDLFKPLHPIFVLSFYPESRLGVKVEYILENAWSTKLEDQRYSLALETGNPPGATVYSKSAFTHVAASRWRQVFWSGVAPPGWIDEGRPGINVNYNLAYLVASKALPNFDLSIAVPASTISDQVNAFNLSDRGDINGYALWTQYMPETGGRPDIGLIPAWYVQYIYSMDPGMYSLLVGMGEVSGYVPFHFRESAKDKFFDSGQSIPAFGLPISIDARPTVYLNDFDFETQPADRITPVGNMTTNGWTVDLAHRPAFAYLPYLITGDWYFLEELYFAAGHDLGVAVNGNESYSRHNSWGWFNDLDVQTRGQAWGRRDIAQAAFMAPDLSPEKNYFTEKVNNNLAIEEGYQNTTAGSFYEPCTTNYDEALEGSKWCWGRRSAAQNWSNPLHYGSMGGSFEELILDPDLVPQRDQYAPEQADRPWQTLYKLNVAGHIQELGFAAAGANNTAFNYLIDILANPSFNPYLCGAYTMATVSKAGTFYQDWTTLLNSFNSSFQTDSGMVNLRTIDHWWDSGSDDTAPDGFPHICQAAASYLVGLSEGPYSGKSAWQWTVSHIRREALITNPQYSILPRADPGAGSP